MAMPYGTFVLSQTLSRQLLLAQDDLLTTEFPTTLTKTSACGFSASNFFNSGSEYMKPRQNMNTANC